MPEMTVQQSQSYTIDAIDIPTSRDKYICMSANYSIEVF